MTRELWVIPALAGVIVTVRILQHHVKHWQPWVQWGSLLLAGTYTVLVGDWFVILIALCWWMAVDEWTNNPDAPMYPIDVPDIEEEEVDDMAQEQPHPKYPRQFAYNIAQSKPEEEKTPALSTRASSSILLALIGYALLGVGVAFAVSWAASLATLGVVTVLLAVIVGWGA